MGADSECSSIRLSQLTMIDRMVLGTQRKDIIRASLVAFMVGGVVGFSLACIGISAQQFAVIRDWSAVNRQMEGVSSGDVLQRTLSVFGSKSHHEDVYVNVTTTASVNSLASIHVNSSGNSSTRAPRILCLVLTHAQAHQVKAQHVKKTWGRRCDVLLFMSTKPDPQLPAIALPVPAGYDYLWVKVKEAFRYVYNHHLNDADWFYKADDDTYAVMENMRAFLSPHATTDPLYFGFRYKPFTPHGYMAGGPGYILSVAALRRFVEKGLMDPNMCKQSDKGAEDAEMGICLDRLGVEAGDTRDLQGRHRFFPFLPRDHLQNPPNYPTWYLEYIYYPQRNSYNCCSDTPIGFHYVPPQQMYTFEYLIYHVRIANAAITDQ